MLKIGLKERYCSAGPQYFMALKEVGGRAGAYSWGVYLSQYVPASAEYAKKAAGKFVQIKTGGQVLNVKGNWLRGNNPATLTLIKRIDSRTSTISILQGKTHEQHYVSNLSFVWPVLDNSSLIGVPAGSNKEGSRVIVASYSNPTTRKLQKFAVQFQNATEAGQCFAVIQDIINAEIRRTECGMPGPDIGCHITEMVCHQQSAAQQPQAQKHLNKLGAVVWGSQQPVKAQRESGVSKMQSQSQSQPFQITQTRDPTQAGYDASHLSGTTSSLQYHPSSLRDQALHQTSPPGFIGTSREILRQVDRTFVHSETGHHDQFLRPRHPLLSEPSKLASQNDVDSFTCPTNGGQDTTKQEQISLHHRANTILATGLAAASVSSPFAVLGASCSAQVADKTSAQGHGVHDTDERLLASENSLKEHIKEYRRPAWLRGSYAEPSWSLALSMTQKVLTLDKVGQACLLDPTFPDYVAQVESVLLDLEGSLGLDMQMFEHEQ